MEGPARSADGGRDVRRLDRAELRRRFGSRLLRVQSPLEASIAEPESAARRAVIAKVHVACVLRPGPSVPRRAPVGGSCIAEIVTPRDPGGSISDPMGREAGRAVDRGHRPPRFRNSLVQSWRCGRSADKPGRRIHWARRNDARHRSKHAPLPNLTGGKINEHPG